MSEFVPMDIWHDDEGIWLQLGPQTFGPYDTESQAEEAWLAFELARTDIAIRESNDQ